MPNEDPKAVYRRIIQEVAVQGNLAAADELLSEDVVEHEKLPEGFPPNAEGIKQLFALIRSAFPDLEITFEDLLVDGDKVVARVTLHGTHQGDFFGLPATGRRVAFEAIDISRVVGGKLVEHWGIPDYMTLFEQLGATITGGR